MTHRLPARQAAGFFFTENFIPPGILSLIGKYIDTDNNLIITDVMAYRV